MNNINRRLPRAFHSRRVLLDLRATRYHRAVRFLRRGWFYTPRRLPSDERKEKGSGVGGKRLRGVLEQVDARGLVKKKKKMREIRRFRSSGVILLNSLMVERKESQTTLNPKLV